MTFRFNRALSLIIVRAKLEGPGGTAVLRLALDTGSSHTVIDSHALESVGVDIESTTTQYRMTTPTGTGSARKVTVDKLIAMEHEHSNFSVMAQALPIELRLDGLLGLDFLRTYTLTIDFQQGLITLA